MILNPWSWFSEVYIDQFVRRYQGTYCGQDVAVKVLNTAGRITEGLRLEFLQEVSIMR